MELSVNCNRRRVEDPAVQRPICIQYTTVASDVAIPIQNMKKLSLLFFLTVALFAPTLSSAASTTSAEGELSPERISEIAELLPGEPTGLGQPIQDRAYWTSPAVLEQTSKRVKSAEALLTREFPAWDDEAYLDFSKTGMRPRGEKMENARSSWLTPLVLAECVENKGRFLPLINKILEAYAAEPTWTMPAHDGNLACFHRQQYDVDLRAATFGFDLAGTLFLLGDRLDPAVREQVRDALQQRLFEPFRRALRTGSGCWWLGSAKKPKQNNWNAVCLSGVVGAALMLIPDKSERAIYVAAAEHYPDYYLNSFASDGYCEEGTGYWGYGFGSFVVLREVIVEATGGKIDLLSKPRTASMALYGSRVLIGPAAVAPFGDCRFGMKPDMSLLAYCNDAMALGLKLPPFSEMARSGHIAETLMTVTPCAAYPGGTVNPEDPLRSYFDKAGVLACRPAPESSFQLGIGIKAGGNGSHSHNDIGAYAIAIGDDEPTGDPGGPFAYDGKTFGSHRYDYKILNSYGHPVPVVAGQLQIEAGHAKPVVVSSAFTKDRDEIKIDMTSAYNVPVLKQLTRTMAYSRAGVGEVEITDEVAFTADSTFEDALITHGDWKQLDARTIAMTSGRAKVIVTIETPGGFTVRAEKIEELGAPAFTRLGLVLNEPVSSAKVRMTFKPSSQAETQIH